MLSEAPVLILAYNRPDKTKALIENLRKSRPKTIVFSVDGPRGYKNSDDVKVDAVQSCLKYIDWTDDVTTIFRSSNLGLRAAVPDAVSQVIDKYGTAIVLEDDLEISETFLDYCNWALKEFKNESEIAHISGYSAVPLSNLNHPDNQVRLSKFPQSFGWATWNRSWSNYDDSMTWFNEIDFNDLLVLFNNPVAAAHWWLVLENVRTGRISSWAYRWIQSIWQKKQFAIAPNRSLVVNKGFDEGSHNLTKAPWKEPELGYFEIPMAGSAYLDFGAEFWISRIQNRNTLLGLIREIGVTTVRAVVREKH